MCELLQNQSSTIYFHSPSTCLSSPLRAEVNTMLCEKYPDSLHLANPQFFTHLFVLSYLLCIILRCVFPFKSLTEDSTTQKWKLDPWLSQHRSLTRQNNAVASSSSVCSCLKCSHNGSLPTGPKLPTLILYSHWAQTIWEQSGPVTGYHTLLENVQTILSGSFIS